jgi:ABC-2 type transport system permease protein
MSDRIEKTKIVADNVQVQPNYSYSPVTSLYTLVRKEVIRILRIWPQTLIPPVITMTLYFVIFGTVMGSKMPSMQGYSAFSYIEFIVPGLIMMSVITNSFSNVVSSFFSSKFQRNIEEIMISPMSLSFVITGFVLGGVIRGLLIGIIVTIISLGFSNLQIHNILVILTVITLTAILFSLGGFLNAIFARKFDDISIFPTFILSPLTYLGGVFYSIALLPDIWQTVSKFNPILYMVNAFRYGFLGKSDIQIEIAFGFLILSIIILYIICLRLLKKGYGIIE